MPWYQEAMKDVGSCEKLRGVATQTLIRRCPNGKTCAGESQPSHTEYIGVLKPTRGTETSKYPEEEKSTEIPQVAASERGPSLNLRYVSLQAL